MDSSRSFAAATPGPVPLGLKKSFGYGDRLGLATPGHFAAHRKFDFAPVFAQQSIREMTRTGRTPREVMASAQGALTRIGFDGAWGADADHLKTLADVENTSEAGFCFFTIDPSDHVEDRADGMKGRELAERIEALEREEVFHLAELHGRYLNRSFETEDHRFVFSREELDRAAVKYGRAIAHTVRMARGIAKLRADEPYELEVSVDETDSPTSPLEHLFYGLELKHRGVAVIGLAPRFVGAFEKGIDYRGQLEDFEKALEQHVAIARFCGPYKISVHSGSDKFSVYPVIGRVCGDLLHVKTAGTSYLEALRTALRVDRGLFREIATFCGDRFARDRASYHISTADGEVTDLVRSPGTNTEEAFLDRRAGRQMLHVTFGSVLTEGKDERGQPFRERLISLLQDHAQLHHDLLEQHFHRHLGQLMKG